MLHCDPEVVAALVRRVVAAGAETRDRGQIPDQDRVRRNRSPVRALDRVVHLFLRHLQIPDQARDLRGRVADPEDERYPAESAPPRFQPNAALHAVGWGQSGAESRPVPFEDKSRGGPFLMANRWVETFRSECPLETLWSRPLMWTARGIALAEGRDSPPIPSSRDNALQCWRQLVPRLECQTHW